MSLEADDGKFQPTAASEIAKWILFLHAKNISAKMWLRPALNMGYLNSAIKDMLSSPNDLFCLWIPVVWRLSWINCLTVFLSSCTSGCPHLTVRLSCSTLAPVNLFPTFTIRLCGSIAPPDRPVSVPCNLIHLEYSSGSLALWFSISLDCLARDERVGGEWRWGTHWPGSLSMGSPRSGCIPSSKISTPIEQLPS